jgi:hypothetical protein
MQKAKKKKTPQETICEGIALSFQDVIQNP